jgi:hypothetical protein
VPPVLNVVILPQVVNPRLLTGGHFILSAGSIISKNFRFCRLYYFKKLPLLRQKPAFRSLTRKTSWTSPA